MWTARRIIRAASVFCLVGSQGPLPVPLPHFFPHGVWNSIAESARPENFATGPSLSLIPRAASLRREHHTADRQRWQPEEEGQPASFSLSLYLPRSLKYYASSPTLAFIQTSSDFHDSVTHGVQGAPNLPATHGTSISTLALGPRNLLRGGV